jgi:phage shock protein B
MDGNLTAVFIVAIVWIGIVASKAIKARIQMGGQLSAQDQAALAAMANTAQRLEQRVMTLEHILDAEVPAWRSNMNAGPAGWRP